MNKYVCPKCGCTNDNVNILSHPGNRTTEAVLCNECYHIWLLEIEEETKEQFCDNVQQDKQCH